MPSASLESLSEDFLIIILSYGGLSYREALVLFLASKDFYQTLGSIMKRQDPAQRRDMSKFGLKFDLQSCFWNGFCKHSPFWLTNKDVLAFHLLGALKNSEEDRDRTDRVLFYIANSKVFEDSGLMKVRREEYLHSLARFATENLANPRLYVFLELSGLGHWKVDPITPLSVWTQYYFIQYQRLDWMISHFFDKKRVLNQLSSRDFTGKLKRRISRLKMIYKNLSVHSIALAIASSLAINVLVAILQIFGLLNMFYPELFLKVFVYARDFVPLEVLSLFIFFYVSDSLLLVLRLESLLFSFEKVFSAMQTALGSRLRRFSRISK